ncbi:MAG TPA: RNA methyltransferase [Nitrososphaerales archaeon]|nr:RNA methyltransferase [Nitrososphaerales archaeon]
MIPHKVSVTLVEPRYPVNVGYVARVMKNFGVESMFLVRPSVDMAVAAIYAAHGADVLEKARVVSWSKLRKSNEVLIATTAIRAKRRSNIVRRGVTPEDAMNSVPLAKSTSIVFGRETTGLTNEEIRACDITTVIATGSRYPTLNISHAAAILLYILANRQPSGRRGSKRNSRELFARQLRELALASRLPSYKADNIGEEARRAAAVSKLTDRQLVAMAGVFRRAVNTIEERQFLDSKT